MKVVIAPDSFKESLSAREVAAAIAAGLREVFSDAEIRCIPMADGGEGTVDAMAAAMNGRVLRAVVTGPMGEAIAASFAITANGKTAILEIAAASGLELVPLAKRDPLLATSYGTGELILAALEAGVRHCIIGIGGSATVDGGAGMLQALGATLRDGDGHVIEARGGASLARVRRIDLSKIDKRIAACNIEVACDVDNPLLGENGAAAVFGPQKGATVEMIVELERNLTRFAEALRVATGIDVATIPGGGAAGGLGAAFVACLGATLRPGVALIAELVGLEDALQDADLVVTGEGRIDGQTARGKTPVGVAALAKRYGKPVIALAGSVGANVGEVYRHGIDAVFSIQQRPCSREEAFANAAGDLQATARNVARLWKTSDKSLG